MRKHIVLSITEIIFFLLSSSCVVKNGNKYKDGEFAGTSRSIYQREYF